MGQQGYSSKVLVIYCMSTESEKLDTINKNENVDRKACKVRAIQKNRKQSKTRNFAFQ